MEFISNIFIRWGSSFVLILFSIFSEAQYIHISHCMSGCPRGDSDNDFIVRHLYAAEINSENGLPDWVAYRILPNSVGVASLLPRRWDQDTLLSEVQPFETAANPSMLYQLDLSEAQDRDYRINEFLFNTEDRGRLAPMTSFSNTPYWSELNYLSNMAPLPSDLRLGSWSRLDQAINELVATIGPLYVISGPLYESTNGLAVGEDILELSLPNQYFKVIATPSAYAAFVFSSKLPIHAQYCAQITFIDKIQELSGLKFFPDLKDELTPELYAGLRCKI